MRPNASGGEVDDDLDEKFVDVDGGDGTTEKYPLDGGESGLSSKFGADFVAFTFVLVVPRASKALMRDFMSGGASGVIIVAS